MIERLSGTIVQKDSSRVVIDVNGVGYGVGCGVGRAVGATESGPAGVGFPAAAHPAHTMANTIANRFTPHLLGKVRG